MGRISAFRPEKLVIGVLSTRPERMDELTGSLNEHFGEIERIIGPFPFTFTSYYDAEMGEGISRYFYVMRDLIEPDKLADIKIRTNRIETSFTEDGLRKINLDPGSMSIDRFVLATTKDRGHRIPLRRGIFGEVTLIYMKGGFQTLPWTYADFRTEEYRNLLKEIRTSYISQLRQG